jgi:hypothetical protein
VRSAHNIIRSYRLSHRLLYPRSALFTRPERCVPLHAPSALCGAYPLTAASSVQGSAPKPVKRKLVQLLKGSVVKLAKLGAASRLLEALFLWADIQDKEAVAKPLADRLSEVKVCCICNTMHYVLCSLLALTQSRTT